MLRVIISILFFCLAANTVSAQQTREDLEKQKQQLKKEIEETQKQLNSVNYQTKKNLTTLALIANKERLQERLVEISGKDIHILDDNIYVIQRDINRYDRLLDTLKQEYAKSMVYSYKNRGNYEFLNFIFSADNFNDAVKRISYLKSYRNFREMQGENILRTQELRRKRLEDLGVSKEKKETELEIQSKEADELAKQKAEQDKIVVELKKQGKDLNARIAAKKKDMAKVDVAVKAAIAKAIKEEKDARDAAAKKRKDDLAAAAKNNAAANPKTSTPEKTTPLRPSKTSAPVAEPASEDFNKEDIALNASFEKNRGILPWPVDNGAIIMHFGPNILPGGGGIINSSAVTISSPAGTAVKVVFDGVIIMVTEIDDGKDAITVKHGDYYTTYTNLTNVTVKKGEEVKTGQVLGRTGLNFDGIGSIDFYCAKGYNNFDPEKWLRARR
jgi:septal ring factor EnvC (AmiA/AmiB activator)